MLFQKKATSSSISGYAVPAWGPPPMSLKFSGGRIREFRQSRSSLFLFHYSLGGVPYWQKNRSYMAPRHFSILRTEWQYLQIEKSNKTVTMIIRR